MSSRHENNPYYQGKAIYVGSEFPEFSGKTVDVWDDNSNKNGPCYQIRFEGSSDTIENMHDEDLEFNN